MGRLRGPLVILSILTAFSAWGLGNKLTVSGEGRYLWPVVVLFLAGCASLAVAWHWSVFAALRLYGALSSIGLLLMFFEHNRAGAEWSPLTYLPSLGPLIIGAYVCDLRATTMQAGITLAANLLTAIIYGELSGVLSLWLATIILSIVACQLCQFGQEQSRQDAIDQKQRELQGALKTVDAQMEAFAHARETQT